MEFSNVFGKFAWNFRIYVSGYEEH